MFHMPEMRGGVRGLRRTWYLGTDGRSELRSCWVAEMRSSLGDSILLAIDRNQPVTQNCDTHRLCMCD
jgi:hypothetical protein